MSLAFSEPGHWVFHITYFASFFCNLTLHEGQAKNHFLTSVRDGVFG